MKIAVYPGSFDPLTNGHLDIIERSSKIFDEVIVSVLINIDKNTLFTTEERVELIKKVVEPYKNVKVESFDGLLIDYVKQKNSNVIIKGLRALSDFDYEFQMALMNHKLDSNIETVFMMTNAKYSYVSSSSIKQVAKFGGCLKDLVPDVIIPSLTNKFRGD